MAKLMGDNRTNEIRWLGCEEPVEVQRSGAAATSPTVAKLANVEDRGVEAELFSKFGNPSRQDGRQFVPKELLEESMPVFGFTHWRELENELSGAELQAAAPILDLLDPQQILSPKETDAVTCLEHLRINRSVTSCEIELLENPGTLFQDQRSDRGSSHPRRRGHFDPRTADGDSKRFSLARPTDLIRDLRIAESHGVPMDRSCHGFSGAGGLSRVPSMKPRAARSRPRESCSPGGDDV